MASNPIFEKNLAALKKHHPDLARRIAELPDVPAVIVKKTEAGEWNIACQFADGSSKWFYPDPSPGNYSVHFLSQEKFENPRLLVFLGLGLGLHLLEYLKKPHPLNQAMIVFENQIHFFKKALETSDFSEAFAAPRVFWVVGNDLETARLFLNAFYSNGPWLMLADAIEYVNFPPSCQTNPSYYLAIQDLIPKAIAHHFNRVFSDPYDAYRGAENFFKNLPLIFRMPSFEKARGFLKGKPAVLIASGPSLTESLPILREIQDRVPMIACPSALSLLIQNGIHPHLWLNIERDENVGDLFRDLPEKPDHVFVGPPLVHPKCFATNQGYNAYLLSQGLFAHWLPFLGKPIDFGHSAANAAFRILEVLGCSDIYLVGQDLSYARNQESHVPGAWEETKRFSENLQKENRQTLSVEGNDGRPILTNLYWHTYLKNFTEQLIPSFPGQVHNVIPSGYGAKIAGTVRLDPAELLMRFEKRETDFLASLKAVLKPPSPEETLKTSELFSEKIGTALECLKEVIAENRKFSLKCKELTFMPAFMNRKPEEALPLWKRFLDDFSVFCNRYYVANHPRPDIQETYRHFFHSIVQGLIVKNQIEFFGSAKDLSGDFGEINRKLDLIFNLLKDESYWAEMMVELLSSNGSKEF